MSIKLDLIKANERGLCPPQNWTHRAVRRIQQLEQQNKEMLEMLKLVVGMHIAPADCYTTGPLHGDLRDVLCPSCEALKLIAKIESQKEGG